MESIDDLMNTNLKLQDNIDHLEDQNEELRVEVGLLRRNKIRYEKMRNQTEKLQHETEKMRDNINDLITCQICLERFQSAGERIPCKLKCPHIMCKKCADSWLTKVSCCTLII